MKTKDMLQVEELGDESLPPGTDITCHVNPPEKAQQVGVSAGQSLLRGFFNFMPDDGERRAQVIIDLTVHTTDITRAFIHERLAKSFGSPCYYLGFTANDDHQEWCRHILGEYMVEGLLEDRLKMPTGAVLPPSTMPADQLQAVPPPPALNLLTINNRVKIDQLPTLKCPDKILAAWHDHSRFGSEFRAFLESARNDLLLDVPAEKGDQESTTRKRGGAGGGSQPLPVPTGKVAKTEEVVEVASGKVIKVDDLPTPLRFDAALPKKGPAVVITVGQKNFWSTEATKISWCQWGQPWQASSKGCGGTRRKMVIQISPSKKERRRQDQKALKRSSLRRMCCLGGRICPNSGPDCG